MEGREEGGPPFCAPYLIKDLSGGCFMWRYILKRCLLIIPITLGVSFIVFSIMAVTPGDPATMILGNGGTQEEIDRINHELGYDKPFLVRYGDYLYKAIIRQDLGTSYQFKTSVWSNISGDCLFPDGGLDGGSAHRRAVRGETIFTVRYHTHGHGLIFCRYPDFLARHDADAAFLP